MVLVRNLREKGGTGKLRCYWEESIFKVIAVEENVPVYKIRNVKKNKGVRTVHRNHLMKVELPLDIFEDKVCENPKEKVKGKKLERKGNNKKLIDKNLDKEAEVPSPVEDSEDSDVELVFEKVLVEEEEGDVVGRSDVSRREHELENDNDQKEVSKSECEARDEEQETAAESE